MKRLIFVFALGLFWLNANYVNATPLGDAIREVDRASVQIIMQCDYNMKVKDADAAPVKRTLNFFGNGSFIEHPELAENSHFAITAMHVVACPQELNKRFFDDKFTIEQVASFEIKIKILVKHGVSIYTAVISKQDFNKDPDLDLAILDVLIPSGAHGRNPVLTDDNAYDIGDTVIVRGFMPGGLLRLKVAHIEDILGDKLLKYQTETEGIIDVSFAVRLKKEYFEKPIKP